MNNEAYERLQLDITPFDAEDVITTSEIVDPEPPYTPGGWETGPGM